MYRNADYVLRDYTVIVHVEGPAWQVSKALALRTNWQVDEILAIQDGAPARAVFKVTAWSNPDVASQVSSDLEAIFGKKPVRYGAEVLAYLSVWA